MSACYFFIIFTKEAMSFQLIDLIIEFSKFKNV